jgi:hypothetical protein
MGGSRLPRGRAFTGDIDARHRRDRHRGDADQCRRRVGAVGREEMAVVGACGQHQAADSAAPAVR